MTNETTASVIILAYNHRDSIRDALDSVLAQKCAFQFEVIVGDDASADDTRRIVGEYTARYPEKVRLMPAAPNKGIVDNYFDCLLAAKGKYIGDCAGDDRWADPLRLGKQVEWLENHPECSTVMSDWIINDAGIIRHSSALPEYGIYRQPIAGRDMLRLILGVKRHFPLFSAMLYRREILTEVLMTRPETLRRREWRCEDLPAIATLASKGDFGYLPLDASEYAINPKGVTNTPDLRKLFDFYLAAAHCTLDLCDIHGIGGKWNGHGPGDDIFPEKDHILRALRARLDYLCSLALTIGDPERRRLLRGLIDRVSPRHFLKDRLYLLIMSTPLLRKPGAHMKSLLRR